MGLNESVEMHVIVVGGVAGGASAAARLRRLMEHATITVFERGPYVSFANCGLPYFVGNVIKRRSALELMTPDLFKRRFNIDVKVNHEVLSINPADRELNVRDLTNNQKFTVKYDKLILSPGAEPFIPSIKGLELVPYFKLRDIPDMEKIINYINENQPKHATVVGGGYIGIELAENLHALGKAVSIVEMMPKILPIFDLEMAQILHQELALNEVRLFVNEKVVEIIPSADGRFLLLTEKGQSIETELIIMSVGIRPESKLAQDAGLQVSMKNYIQVNEQMQTSDSNIYAVGDAVEVQNMILNEPWGLALAGPANREGRVVADVIAGLSSKFEGVIGTSVIKVFGLTASMVGMNEKVLKEKNIPYEKVYLHPNNHAGYYPDAVAMSIKLLFETPTGRILGAQIIGGPGTEKRIDVLATVMKFNGTVFDLERLELAYAPPYGSAKDPINMAGFLATNILQNLTKVWHWHDLATIKESDGFLLDVRTKGEFKVSHIDGAINIPDTELRENLAKIPADKPIYVYCQVGFRGYLSSRVLLQSGFSEVYNLSGGFKTYDYATKSLEQLNSSLSNLPLKFKKQASSRPAEDVIQTSEQEIIDASGLACPGPINALLEALQKSGEQYIRIISTDPAFISTIRTYVEVNPGVQLLSLKTANNKIIAEIHKNADFIDVTSLGEVELENTEMEQRVIRPVGLPVVSEISPEDLRKEITSTTPPAIIIDVREPGEWKRGHLKQASLITLGTLPDKLQDLAQYMQKEIVTVCASGKRSYLAAQLLEKAGFEYIRSLRGGMIAWQRAGYDSAK